MQTLRPFQKKALHVLKKNCHLIVISETGSGKSYIFQKYIKNNNNKVLLVSPLVALSRQHHNDFLKLKIKSFIFKSSTSERLKEALSSQCWILSPESIFHPPKMRTIEKLKLFSPDLLVIDECHCFWDWGSSFRPAFLNLPLLIQLLNIKKSLWLTATLPKNAYKALETNLPHLPLTQGKFSFPKGISLRIIKMSHFDRLEAIKNWIHYNEKPGIIFIQSRKMAERIFILLKNLGINCILYHAGLSKEERNNIEKIIAHHPPRVILATSAFGMGMNYPFLNWLILFQPPLTLLQFTQTIGRIGRNGATGRAIVFWDEYDFEYLTQIFKLEKNQKKELSIVKNIMEQPDNFQKILSQYFV